VPQIKIINRESAFTEGNEGNEASAGLVAAKGRPGIQRRAAFRFPFVPFVAFG
jgi:hypothetical protein